MTDFSHFNAQGEAHMVDVGGKDQTVRIAVCEGSILMQAKTLEKIIQGDHKKGDVLSIARIAGIMAAKKTSELIPLCHPLMLTHIGIDFAPDTDKNVIVATCRVETHGQTGVEMEALTAVQVALLTIYDMCKALDRGMNMTNIHLIEKKGGKSGHWAAKKTTF